MPKSSKQINKQKNAVTVEHLTVKYDHFTVLEDVNITIPEGSIAAVIGPNGSGKSTLVKAILDLIPVHEGSISIFDTAIRHVRPRIGYVAQRFDFDRQFPITVEEFLRLSSQSNISVNTIKSAIHEVGLFDSILTHKLGTLSGGQLQRILIAQAIMHQPDLLILDEPSTGIDIMGEATFYSILDHLNQHHGTTILMVSHDVTMVQKNVDIVLCVNKRLLCSGPPNKTLTDTQLKKLYGDHRHAFKHEHHKKRHL